MWPTLEVGQTLKVVRRGRGKAFAAMLLRKGQDGTLWLALVPSTPRRWWRPLELARFDVKEVYAR